MDTTCPTCGLDERTIAPTDVPVALRSYPRRFRALLTGFDEDDDADALVRRKPDERTWSALACTAYAGEYFDAVADAIARMLVEDRPALRLPEPDLGALEKRASAEPVAAVLDHLTAAAERLAATCDAIPVGDWHRTATLPSGERDVLGVARTAVHEGHHLLRDVERILTAVRGRPLAPNAKE